MAAESSRSLLHTWMRVSLPPGRRWAALHALCARRACRRGPELLRLMLALESPKRRATRLPRVTRAERRAAAVALLQMCRSHPHLRGSWRVQSCIARGLALALPPRLSTPRLLRHLLCVEECLSLLSSARKHGEEHGWGSIHRLYPTVDLPLAALCGGAEVAARVSARAFAAFESLFGASCGPPESLTLRDCFVAKYEAGGQAGLAGHVDPSFLSLVMTLNPTAEFDGGGTYFEHADRTVSPEQGDAVCFLGKVFHEGRPITRGVRYVLVLLADRRSQSQAAEMSESDLHTERHVG
jgi:hypothetical protein